MGERRAEDQHSTENADLFGLDLGAGDCGWILVQTTDREARRQGEDSRCSSLRAKAAAVGATEMLVSVLSEEPLVVMEG